MLFEKRTVIDSSIEAVFNLVADIATAPNIHPMIIKRERLDEGTLGLGSKFRYSYAVFGIMNHFDFEIVEFIPHEKVSYRGTPFFGIIPQFAVHFRLVECGVEVQYVMNPTIPNWMIYPAKMVMIPVGNRDLEAYFKTVKLMLEA